MWSSLCLWYKNVTLCKHVKTGKDRYVSHQDTQLPRGGLRSWKCIPGMQRFELQFAFIVSGWVARGPRLNPVSLPPYYEAQWEKHFCMWWSMSLIPSLGRQSLWVQSQPNLHLDSQSYKQRLLCLKGGKKKGHQLTLVLYRETYYTASSNSSSSSNSSTEAGPGINSLHRLGWPHTEICLPLLVGELRHLPVHPKWSCILTPNIITISLMYPCQFYISELYS